MRYDLLRCPYCHAPLRPKGKELLICSCDTYPVVQGIVYLKKNESKARAIRFLLGGNRRAAMMTLLDSRRIANLFAVTPAPIQRFGFRLLRLVYPSGSAWWEYLSSRSRRVTHLLALCTTGVIRNGDMSIDIACGQGDFIEGASSLSRSDFIGVDISYYLLLIARLHRVPKRTLLVCSDTDQGLPFERHIADHIFF